MSNIFSLKGRRILITAGSTWVPIDTVRVITNIFKGKIGLTIATTAVRLGANVTLLLGPSLDISNMEIPKSLNVVRFKYFDELDSILRDFLNRRKFDAVIHSAAVSDFQLDASYTGKLKSDSGELILHLIPTKKIVDYIKTIAPHIILVKFKLEVGISESKLIDVAYKSLKHSNANLIVASVYDPQFNDHEAYIIDTNCKVTKTTGKEKIAEEILKHVHDRI